MTNGQVKEINNTKISSRLRQAVVLLLVILIGIVISLLTEA